MTKSALISTWVLLLFRLLCPIQILAQYASPYLGNTIHALNPAVNVWKEDSFIAIGYGYYTKSKMSSEKKKTVQHNDNNFNFAYISETFGFPTTLELYASNSNHNEKFTEYEIDCDSSTTTCQITDEYNQNEVMVDKSGSIAFGSFAVGYTDVNEMEMKQNAETETSSAYGESVLTGKKKFNRLGFSLRLSNFYIGALQVKGPVSEYKMIGSATQKSSSSVDYVSTMTANNFTQTENYTAIGYRYFKKNGFRFEIYKKEVPVYDMYITTLLEFVDYPENSLTQFKTQTSTKEETVGLNLEAIIGNYNYIVEYYQYTDFDAGSSSGKPYPNDIGQKKLLGVALPLSENLRFGITFSEEDTTQPYLNSSGYYSYSTK